MRNIEIVEGEKGFGWRHIDMHCARSRLAEVQGKKGKKSLVWVKHIPVLVELWSTTFAPPRFAGRFLRDI